MGLSVSDGYIATGSETNEVSFCIHFLFITMARLMIVGWEANLGVDRK